MKLLIMLGCLVWLTILAGCTLPVTTSVRYPIGLSFVPEMDYIPEVDDWSIISADEYVPETQNALREWQKYYPWVQSELSPAMVRALSRWSVIQMQEYRTVPSLAGISLKPAAIQLSRKKLLLEGTVDTLPTHSPLVTRWLKLFVIYDIDSGVILRVTITIRGQVLE